MGSPSWRMPGRLLLLLLGNSAERTSLSREACRASFGRWWVCLMGLLLLMVEVRLLLLQILLLLRR